MNGISNFEIELQNVVREFPSLMVGTSSENNKILQGEIYVSNETSDIGDNRYCYSIEIHPHIFYPNRFPLLFETGEIIPRIPDWHIYPKVGNCCVAFTRQEEIRCSEGITIVNYIKEFAIPFLKNTTYRRIVGEYYTGVYAHNPVLATYQFYKDLLFDSNLLNIMRLLKFINNNNPPNRTSLCFCGKNVKYRYCHKESYEKIKRIKSQNIEDDIKIIQVIYNQFKQQ